MNSQRKDEIWGWLTAVADPEVPVLTIADLGVLRDLQVGQTSNGDEEVVVTITPTYSGCPAMDLIAFNIRMALMSHGVKNIRIEPRLSPAWTTDWMTEEGKRKLKEYGIAPPQRKAKDALGLFEDDKVPCPRCGSDNTELTSQFGPTSCKSLYRCMDCKEPFEHFKCH